MSMIILMNTCFKMDTNKLRFYHSENNGWHKAIALQVNEIPEMEKMLTDSWVTEDPENIMEMQGKDLFSVELKKQEEEMRNLNKEIEFQQKKLQTRDVFDMNACIDVFCAQDILRERIRNIEKKYLELKCNLMYYLSNLT